MGILSHKFWGIVWWLLTHPIGGDGGYKRTTFKMSGLQIFQLANKIRVLNTLKCECFAKDFYLFLLSANRIQLNLWRMKISLTYSLTTARLSETTWITFCEASVINDKWWMLIPQCRPWIKCSHTEKNRL